MNPEATAVLIGLLCGAVFGFIAGRFCVGAPDKAAPSKDASRVRARAFDANGRLLFNDKPGCYECGSEILPYGGGDIVKVFLCESCYLTRKAEETERKNLR